VVLLPSVTESGALIRVLLQFGGHRGLPFQVALCRDRGGYGTVRFLARTFLTVTSSMIYPLNVCIELGGMSASCAFGVFYDVVMGLVSDLS
jgi:hypothetical protein